jgi:hypothetical protein
MEIPGAIPCKGYKVGTVEQFLDLTTEESEYIELKLALFETLAKRRRRRYWHRCI